MPLELTISTEEKVQVTVAPVDVHGHPAQLDGPVQFSVTSGDATIEPVSDMAAFLVSGAMGDSAFLVSADADLGAGVVTIEDTITLHVTNPMATSLGMQADEPVLK